MEKLYKFHANLFKMEYILFLIEVKPFDLKCFDEFKGYQKNNTFTISIYKVMIFPYFSKISKDFIQSNLYISL